MKRFTTLMTATAASAFACATTALAGAAAMAQDDAPHTTEGHMETRRMPMSKVGSTRR